MNGEPWIPESPPTHWNERALQLHDAFLDGLYMTRNRALILTGRLQTGRSFTLLIPNARRVRTTDFSEGNIIFDIEWHSPKSCTRDLMQRLQNHTLPDREERITRDLAELQTRGETLFEVTSSYGCEIVGLTDAFPHGVCWWES